MEKSKSSPIIHFVQESDQFVGIKINANEINMYLPQVFRIEQNEKINNKFLLKFLLSISNAKKILHDSFEGSFEGEVWPLESYIWIISDYLRNGYYFSRDKISSNIKTGKIDWKKTIKTMPMYSEKKFMYTNIITTRTVPSNDIMTQIYKVCLKKAIARIGWAFKENIYVDVMQIKTTKEMIYIVKKIINSTYDDIKKLRFKHILKILTNFNDDETEVSNLGYGINNYHYVFEIMIDSLFKGISGSTKKGYNPYGQWHLINDEPRQSSRLRPDTICLKDNHVVIIDSKMYKYGFTKEFCDLPGTESIQKQVTYGDFVRNCIFKTEMVVIKNCFVLPYNKELAIFREDKNINFFMNNNLALIGQARPVWKGVNIQSHDKIFVFLIDFNFLLDKYKGSSDVYVGTLIEVLQECD